MTTWLISDTHLHHRNIIRYARRPFGSVGEMDREIFRRWNRTVRPGDLVYHLGDFGFGPVDVLTADLAGLNGAKVLIKGSHDRGTDAMLKAGFAAVLERAIIRVDGCPTCLSHEPLQFLPDGCFGVFHGHVHRGNPADLHKAGECPFIQPFCLNLSCEMTEYRPISAKAALKRLRKQLGR